jgi:hypothetical protein
VLRDEVRVEIHDAAGARVLNTSTRVQDGRCTLDVSVLASGTYTLTVHARTAMSATMQIVR